MTDDFFSQNPLFQGLNTDQIELLRPLFIPCECHKGTVLFEQDDPATHFYIVTSGEVVIHFKPEDGQDIVVAHIKPGNLIGWSAVIGRPRYTSAAVCTELTGLLRISGAELIALGDGHRETVNLLTYRLAEAVAERLQQSNPQVLALLEQGLRNAFHPETDQNVDKQYA
jgi:CRP-like cAMP-binding protein